MQILRQKKAPEWRFFYFDITHNKSNKIIKGTPMNLSNIPFCTTDWTEIEPVKHSGETGYALWRTQQFDNIRVRIVEYSKKHLTLAL